MLTLTKIFFTTLLVISATAVPTALDERVACVGRACDAHQQLERDAGQDWLKREAGQDWTKREAGSEWGKREADFVWGKRDAEQHDWSKREASNDWSKRDDLEKRIVLQCQYGKTCCCPNGGRQCMKCVVPGGCTFTCN